MSSHCPHPGPGEAGGPCATSLADTSGLPYHASSPGSWEGLAQLPSLCSCRRAGAFFQGYSGASPPPLLLSPFAFPQPGLSMAELSPVLESSFTTTGMAFLPLQSAIKPPAGHSIPSLDLFVQDPGVVPRCPSAASLHFTELQESLDQTAFPQDHPSFLGKVTISAATQGLRCLVFFHGSAGLGIGFRCFCSGLTQEGCWGGLDYLLGSAARQHPNPHTSSAPWGVWHGGEHRDVPLPSQMPAGVNSWSEEAQTTVLEMPVTWGRWLSASGESPEGAGLQAGCTHAGQHRIRSLPGAAHRPRHTGPVIQNRGSSGPGVPE